jgi:phosphomannomutase
MRAAPIRFGTSGWRGVLGDEFTFERARAVVRAIAE